MEKKEKHALDPEGPHILVEPKKKEHPHKDPTKSRLRPLKIPKMTVANAHKRNIMRKRDPMVRARALIPTLSYAVRTGDREVMLNEVYTGNRPPGTGMLFPW